MKVRESALFVVVLTLAFVGASPGQEETPADEVLLLPFTPTQIRVATKPGRRYRFRLEEAGRPPQFLTTEFLAVSEQGCTVLQGVTDAEWTDLQPAQRREATWEQVAGPSNAFPKEATKVSEVELTVPAGTFACKVYEVDLMAGGPVGRMYFAKELPGPPVKTEMLNRQASGDVVVRSMVLLEYRPGT